MRFLSALLLLLLPSLTSGALKVWVVDVVKHKHPLAVSLIAQPAVHKRVHVGLWVVATRCPSVVCKLAYICVGPCCTAGVNPERPYLW